MGAVVEKTSLRSPRPCHEAEIVAILQHGDLLTRRTVHSEQPSDDGQFRVVELYDIGQPKRGIENFPRIISELVETTVAFCWTEFLQRSHE